jgi:hypothetical protein
MSQLMACKSSHGIILATDSQTEVVDGAGNINEATIERLVPLTRCSLILTGGAAEGERMCRSLGDFLHQENITEASDVYTAALPFLASEYEKFMRKTCQHRPLIPNHQFHFILAGYSEKDQKNPFKLFLLWTKKKLPQIDREEIRVTYTIPRLMGFEYRLSRMCEENLPLPDILGAVKSEMEKQARKNEEISGPFRYAVLSADSLVQTCE